LLLLVFDKGRCCVCLDESTARVPENSGENVAPREKTEELRVRLESIHIDGYRSCRDTTFTPNSDLSALIGINGAGKTNILQAIRLLDLQRTRTARRSSESIVAGTTRLTAWFKVNEARVGLRLTLSSVDTGRRPAEMVSVDEHWNLFSLTGSKAWRPMPPARFLREAAGMNEIASGEKHLFIYDEGLELIRHKGLEKFDFSVVSNSAAVQALIAISDFRAGISYYSASQFTDPSRCPSSFEVDEEGRLSDLYGVQSTSAHMRFVHSLYSLRRENQALYDQYCEFVSRRQLGLISRLTWKEVELSSSTAEVKGSGTVKKTKKRKTLVIPKVQIGKSHITFNQLSEGTFKTLALAFYIITDSSKFLMVEEPEVCVHHGLLRRIVGTIKSHSARKQTIISTHSDLLVDDLEPGNVFVVEMTPGGTRVKGLESWLDQRGLEALHSYLNESGTLGEYWRSGGLS
jgi:ABC-type Mn2+/Zn2+ transport system ATPase subunit